MTIELIKARKEIKKYLKHMPHGEERTYLEQMQYNLKMFINRSYQGLVSLQKLDDHPFSWKFHNEIKDYYIDATVSYDNNTKGYTFIFDWINPDDGKWQQRLAFERMNKLNSDSELKPHILKAYLNTI